jgi:SAM-dependent methyltransferase
MSAAAPTERALALMTPEARSRAQVSGGIADVIGASDPTGAHPGQRLMVSRALPAVYERWWRPLGGRVLMGALGPGMGGEHDLALDMLQLSAGDRVLDVACGTGAFTRTFAAEAGPESLVVGLDASRTMLERAVAAGGADGGAAPAYVRGDACALPFPDATFDAVCCFAALYLIEDPMAAVDELVRVLAPGGRLAILTSVHRGPLPRAIGGRLVRAATGVRMFGRDEITGALHDRGIARVGLRVSGLGQFVGGAKPAR